MTRWGLLSARFPCQRHLKSPVIQHDATTDGRAQLCCRFVEGEKRNANLTVVLAMMHREYRSLIRGRLDGEKRRAV